MTKCLLFWKKVAEFKAKDDFEGFQKWCGYKSYEQARRDWNAIDTFAIIAKKLGKDLCEVVSSENLSENVLAPIIHQRDYVGKDVTAPDPIQEKAIDILIPKIEKGEVISQADSRKALMEAKGEALEQKTKEINKCPLELLFESEVMMKLGPRRDQMFNCSECPLNPRCQKVQEELRSFADFICSVEI